MVHEFPDNFSFSNLAGMVCMTPDTALGWAWYIAVIQELGIVELMI
jgi:hypothetical protein